eukprot:913573_1
MSTMFKQTNLCQSTTTTINTIPITITIITITATIKSTAIHHQPELFTIEIEEITKRDQSWYISVMRICVRHPYCDANMRIYMIQRQWLNGDQEQELKNDVQEGSISVPIVGKISADAEEDKSEEMLFAYDFSSLSYEKRSINIGLHFDNLLLRGSELRNSDWVYALVIYTGFDCKIFMNNKSRERQPIKRSSVERTLSKFIYYMAGAQFFICLMCAILSGDWTTSNQHAWYLYNLIAPEFFTWFIIFAQFIPISLLVSMEVVKFVQAQFMQWDINMYTRLRNQTDKFCTVQNSNLNEELGQIGFS